MLSGAPGMQTGVISYWNVLQSEAERRQTMGMLRLDICLAHLCISLCVGELAWASSPIKCFSTCIL